MSLITPDFGLLFWMTLIFGIVFFVLAKFGFPAITGMVEKRSGKIEDSLRKADEAEKKLASIAREQERLLEEAHLEQSRILKEASEAREKIISTAREEASREAERSSIPPRPRLKRSAKARSATSATRSRSFPLNWRRK